MAQAKNQNVATYVVIALIVVGIAFYALFYMSRQGYVHVKYRDGDVDISSSYFVSLDKSDSTVKGAWYDAVHEYMIIKLNDTYYHYCGMPSGAWISFTSAASLYDHYQSYIKGNFDCRVNTVPEYK